MKLPYKRGMGPKQYGLLFSLISLMETSRPSSA